MTLSSGDRPQGAGVKGELAEFAARLVQMFRADFRRFEATPMNMFAARPYAAHCAGLANPSPRGGSDAG